MRHDNRNRPVHGARAWRGQRGFLTSRQAFVVLALIFLTPAFVALVMHRTGDDGWRPKGTTNHGMLIQPARPLRLDDSLVYEGRPLAQYLQGKWTLVYLGPADCDDVCRQSLYNMRQVRVAQNENMKRVQYLYLVGEGEFSTALRDLLAREHRLLAVVRPAAAQFRALADQFAVDEVPAEQAGRVYFVDPLGNLMMYYQPGMDAGGMLKDLGKLLKYSRFG